MANNYSAQGGIVIKRLRNGDSFFITLETNGKPLYQSVDPETGEVSPDWSVADNQPIITPNVTSVRGNAVTLSNHAWTYNGVALNFNGTETDNFTEDSTGKFAMNKTTGALRILDNLASTVNMANDTLGYTCVATVAGVEYNLRASRDIQIQSMGASSYYGTITATTEQLTADVTSTTLSTQLWLASGEVSDYHVKWYKDNEAWTDKNGQKSITVSRDDVDGTQLFIAEFYKDSSAVSPLFQAGIRIIDTLDEFQIVPVITSANKEVDTGKPVTVKMKVMNMRTNSEVSISNGTWQVDVRDKDTWESLKSSTSDTITVTTTETDRNGEINDVEVTGEVHWQE